MKTALLLWMLCCAAPAQILPPAQESWTDEVIAGDELLLWLAPDANEPEVRQRVRVRLAAISAPRPSGRQATLLAEQAVLALGYLCASHNLRVRPVAWEKFKAWDDLARPGPTYITLLRLVAVVETPHQDTRKAAAGTSQSVGALMLRAGHVWLRCDYRAELAPDEAEAYLQAETEARAALRGLWRWGGYWTSDESDCPARPARRAGDALPLPQRQPK